MSGSPAARPGRSSLLVGVSVTGLSAERAAAVATIGAAARPPARVWRHVAAGAPEDCEPETASPAPVVLPATVGVRLTQLRGQAVGTTAEPSRPGLPLTDGSTALALPISFYQSAALALGRLGAFVEATLGLQSHGTGDTELRDLGITSDQALDDWLQAASTAGFRAVALWPVAFADPGVPAEEFTTAARHAVQVAVQATSVLG